MSFFSLRFDVELLCRDLTIGIVARLDHDHIFSVAGACVQAGHGLGCDAS
jgi:hypothetical protein